MKTLNKLVMFLLVLLTASAMSFGQATSVNGGSIQGTITDPSGAAIPHASVTITSTDTGFNQVLTTDSAGYYSMGPLNPGNYVVNVTSPNFSKLSVKTVIRTGTATSGNFKLALGNESTTIEVNAGAIQVNTEQVGVTGVITSQQIDTLPVNGRNILDFAQLQPGVQLQAGGNNDGGFDPTKAGYSALSFNGISGRTTRILLDGQDITDETVGTTIFNVSQGAVGEFQVSRATGDVSNEITSSGSVLASTRSGTNEIRGQLFYVFQDQRVGAATFGGVSEPFQRNQYGGSIGGPIIKDKLFFFANSERLKQDQSAPVTLNPEFAAIQAQFPQVGSPDRDTYSTGRLDYNGPWGTHFFARVNYEANAFATGSQYSTYANRDNAPGIAFGADFVRGRFTHSFRGSYEKFHNFIADTTIGATSIYNPFSGFGIENLDGGGLESGPNPNAPQATFQSDKQLRYDGSWTKGAHTIRYGGSLNRIQGGGDAKFFGYGPLAYENSGTLLTNCGIGGPGAAACPDDPLNGYAPLQINISNNLGYASEKPGFGLPGGEQADWRTGFYLADSWKIRPTFTLSVAARYDRDTGRTNSDLPAVPCSEIVLANFPTGYVPPCSGNTPLLNQWGPSLGGRVAQPNKNVGPQLGFNYAPAKLNNKTVFRGGIGVFFESNVFNNVQFDRSSRLPTGQFASYPFICSGNNSYPIPGMGSVTTVPGTSTTISAICNESIAAGESAVLALQAAARPTTTTASLNTGFAGYGLSIENGAIAYGQNYRSPYSININFGIQQQLARGIVATADYVHMGTFRIAQTEDENHVGDSRYFNLAGAQAAIDATLAPNPGSGYAGFPMCPQGHSAAAIDCAIANGATLGDNPTADPINHRGFGSMGLDSGVTVSGGYPTSFSGASIAFPGVNPNVGVGTFALPQGKASYDGLQLNVRGQSNRPFPGLTQGNFEASYAYSRFVSTTADNGISTSDTFFAPPSYNNRLPGTVAGYAGLDRTHIFSIGASGTVKYGLKVGLISHIESAVPSNLNLDEQGAPPGEIFRSDVDGDGQIGDLVPGTNPGAYMRKIKPSNLNKFIQNYNATHAGTFTPAGQVLVASGLVTAAELTAMGGIEPTLDTATGAPFRNSMLKTLDANFSYPIKLSRLRNGMSLEPAVALYNIANFANYSGTTTTVAAVGDISSGDPNSNNDFATRNAERVSRRTGTFDQGAPRATEFQLKLNF